MKIVMTGGTGLLGSKLKAELEKRGHDVIACGHEMKGIENQPGFNETEVLFHLAGAGIADKRWTPSRKKVLRSSRIGSAHLIEKKLKEANAPIKTVITSSGIGIYGDRGDETLTERSLPGRDFLSRLCVDWEAATKDAFPQARWVALRTAPVLSRRGGYLSQILPIFTKVGASSIGDGRQFFSWIHEVDWIALALFCFENKEVRGPINATSAKPLRNSMWTKILSEQFRLFRNLPIPHLALRLAYGQLADALVSSQRALPAKALEYGFQFQFPDAEKALSDLAGDLKKTSAISKIFHSVDRS